jgi:hypothetical protein
MLHHGPGDYSRLELKWVQEDISGGKVRAARKADNLTTICEPIVKVMSDL